MGIVLLCRHELDPSYLGRTVEADGQHGNANSCRAVDEVATNLHQTGVARQRYTRVRMPDYVLRQANLPAVRVAAEDKIKSFGVQCAYNVGGVGEQQTCGVVRCAGCGAPDIVQPGEGVVDANEGQWLTVYGNVGMRIREHVDLLGFERVDELGRIVKAVWLPEPTLDAMAVYVVVVAEHGKGPVARMDGRERFENCLNLGVRITSSMDEVAG